MNLTKKNKAHFENDKHVFNVHLDSKFSSEWETVRMCISHICYKSFSRELTQLQKKIDGLFIFDYNGVWERTEKFEWY